MLIYIDVLMHEYIADSMLKKIHYYGKKIWKKEEDSPVLKRYFDTGRVGLSQNRYAD